MAEDIAQLGFAIDSSQAKRAGEDLERLAGAADKAQKGSEQFAKATEAMATSLAAVARAQQDQTRLLEQLTRQQERVIANTRTISDVAADATVVVAGLGAALIGTYKTLEFGYEQSIGRMKQALVDGTKAIYVELAQVTREASQLYLGIGDQGVGGAAGAERNRQLAQFLGVQGGALSNFQQSLSPVEGLDFSSQVRGIRQIEDAIEGTTVAGVRLRRELEQIGISLDGLSEDDAGAVFDEAGRRALEDSVGSFVRIQEALEGSTAAGIEARKVLRDYGIELRGLSEDEAVQQFIEAIQDVRPGRGLRTDVQTVLGRSDPEFLNRLLNDRSQLSEGQRFRNEENARLAELQAEFFSRGLAEELERRGFGGDDRGDERGFFRDARQRELNDRTQRIEQLGEVSDRIYDLAEGPLETLGAVIEDVKITFEQLVLGGENLFSGFQGLIEETTGLTLSVEEARQVSQEGLVESPAEQRRREEERLQLLSQFPGGERFRAQLLQRSFQERISAGQDQGVITDETARELTERIGNLVDDLSNPLARVARQNQFQLETLGQSGEVALRSRLIQQVRERERIEGPLPPDEERRLIEGGVQNFRAAEELRRLREEEQVGDLGGFAAAARSGGRLGLERAQVRSQARQTAIQGAAFGRGTEYVESLELRRRAGQRRVQGELQLFDQGQRIDQLRGLTQAIQDGEQAVIEYNAAFQAQQLVLNGVIDSSQELAVRDNELRLQFEESNVALARRNDELEKQVESQRAITSAIGQGPAAEREARLQQQLDRQAETIRASAAAAGTPDAAQRAEATIAEQEALIRQSQQLGDDEAFARRQQAGEQRLTSQRQQLELMTLTTDAAAEQQFIFEEINALQAQGVELTDERLAAIQAQAATYGDLQQQIRLTQQFSRGFASAITDGFRAASEQAGSFKEILNEVGKRLLDISKELLIFGPLEDALGALFASGAQAAGGYATGGGGAGGLLASLFASGAASGAGGGAAQPGGQATAQSPVTATAAGAAGAAAPGLFGSILSFFGFESGGIMTANGPVPLRSYNSGGVANSPQLALFGEGSKPEAYVPLPDGRSIPVTMQGGGGGINQTNNITISSGSPEATGGSPENPGLDPEMLSQLERQITQTVRQATVQEMREQSRPRGALRSQY